MQRKKMLIAGLAIALMVGLVSASVITYFGQVKMTATVTQAVLLDGKDYTEMPIEETATVAGGEFFLRPHWLKSQTSVPVSLKFETDITYDGGITVEYYKPVKLHLTKEDFSSPVFGVNVLVYWAGGNVVWEVGINESDIAGHWSTGVQVMIANASEPKFTLGWSPGISTTAPAYKPYNSGVGWGTGTTTLPEGMSVNGTYNQVSYKIEIPVKYLGGCGATFNWAINVEASFAGPQGSKNYQQNYPKDWVRWTATNTTTFHIGEPITSPFTLQPYETLDFIICYKFAVDIYPGTYTIYSTVKPAP